MAPHSENWSSLYGELIAWYLSDLTVGEITQGVPSVLAMMQNDKGFWDETPPHMRELLSTWIAHHYQDLDQHKVELFVAIALGGWHSSLHDLAEAVRVLE